MIKCHRCNKYFKNILYTHSDWPTCKKCLYEHGEEHQLKGSMWDLLWRYWLKPRWVFVEWLKKIVRWQDDNGKKIDRFVHRHRNELVTDGFDIVKLLGCIDGPDDYYYVLLYKKDGWREAEIRCHSCVGWIHLLKRRINWFEYGIIYHMWHMNMPNQKMVKEMLKKHKIKLK